jgi:hypothetical protein
MNQERKNHIKINFTTFNNANLIFFKLATIMCNYGYIIYSYFILIYIIFKPIIIFKIINIYLCYPACVYNAKK